MQAPTATIPPAAVLDRQRAYFASGATRGLEFRRAALDRLISALVAHEEDVLAALDADLGKPAMDAYVTEVGMVLSEARHARRRLRRWMKPRRRRVPFLAWPATAEVRREPFGVVLVIGPWNYPVQLLLAPLVGALAAGNCAVLKPSELAPRSSAVVAKLIAAAFDPDHVAVIEGGRETAEALLAERFDHIFFTGGTEVGRAVMQAAARHLTPVTLELGGKCPAIVAGGGRPDCGALARDLDTIARRLVWGRFMNAGQTCVAPDYVLVERPLHDPLVQALRRAVAECYPADFGRLVNRRHFERVAAYLADGRPACGGGTDPATLRIDATVLTNVDPRAPVMRDEVFGPVLPVLAFDRLDDALAIVRDRPAPLAVYLFTRDPRVRRRVVDETRSGGVCVNDVVVQLTGPDLPFGGVGESGMGRYHGKAGFDCFSHERVVMRRSLGLDSSFRYPPPKVPLERLRRWSRWLFR